MNIADVKVISGGVKLVQHRSKKFATKTIQRFSVFQQTTGTTIPRRETLFGHTNNASFFGLAAGTTRYVSCAFDVAFGLTGGAVPILMQYDFESGDAGVFDYEGVVDDWFLTTAAAVRGQNLASIFSPNIIVTQATQGDFSVFQ